MENEMEYPEMAFMDYEDHLRRMYPDSFAVMNPHAQHIVDSLSDESMYSLTEDDIDRMSQEVMARVHRPGDPPFGARHPGNDLARAIVVRNLLDRHRFRRRPFPIFFPPFFFPFDERDRDHRDRDRDRDHRDGRGREHNDWY